MYDHAICLRVDCDHKYFEHRTIIAYHVPLHCMVGHMYLSSQMSTNNSLDGKNIINIID